ncbi:hypothetical protein N7450_006894 [Penicillium hetheringtonii]|uniref:F-box domain protein n=1 Tax=Penicillium hetheringtonii TaxID=911720 RepID=A0AAD6DGC6_9EURO|nr:hypothetical protein N7450_006894 [Penicillium hetheringtonii]
MALPRHIHDLADELLSEVLFFLLESRPEIGPRGLALTSGGYGNGIVNHSTDQQTIRHGEASDLDRFRLVCKRFMRIGTPRKFAHFNLRFSEDGFRRLDELLEMQLACYVKSMTYLVRPFYQGNGWAPILRNLGTEHPALAQLHRDRLRGQLILVSKGIDLSQLHRAIASFYALQEVKLLRLQDEADERLLDFIRDHSLMNVNGNRENVTRFDWESACSRAVTNLGISLLDSKCSSIRFKGPQISPEATLQLLQAPSSTFAAMGPRLTSLEITFHSHADISSTMSDLSDVFRKFFIEAKSLASIHIGFPSKFPLSVPLDSVFHAARWKDLRSLSIASWRLNAEDLISLLRRHRHKLQDLHLTSIYLRPGGKWTSVLQVLDTEMDHLDRLYLREIDYAAYFDAAFTSAGVEIYDPIPIALPSPSSSTVSVAAGPSPPSSPDLFSNMLVQTHYNQNSFYHGLFEKVRGLSVDELGDDGIHVRRDQEQLWEAWVLASRWERKRGRGNRDQNGYMYGHRNGYRN